MKNKLIWICLLFFIGIKAQNCTIDFTGKVLDFHEKSVLANATVYIKNLNIYATTNEQGIFRFTNLCKGSLVLEISHISCKTKTIQFLLVEDTNKTILLEHHIESLNEISITSNNTNNSKVNEIDDTLIQQNSNASLGEIIKSLPGVNTLNTGQNIMKPIINGLHSSRVLIKVNNVRLQDQDWGVEHAPNIDVNAAAKINVVKGPSALEYGGDAIGGVVVIQPKKVFLKDTLFGATSTSYNTNNQGVSLSSNLQKYTSKGWYVQGNTSYKKFGDGSAANYNLTNTGLSSFSFTIDAGYKNFEQGFDVFYSIIQNEIGILRASHLGNIDDLISAINSSQPSIIEPFSYTINKPKQDVTHQVLKVSYYKRFEGLGKLNLQYDFQNNQRKEFDVRVGEDKLKPATDLALKSHQIETNFLFDSKQNSSYKIGLQTQLQNNFSNPETGVRRIIPNFNKVDLGFYATSTLILNKTMLDVGVRYDFNYINAKKFYLKSRWSQQGYDTDFSQIITADYGTQYLTNPIFKYHNFSASVQSNFQLNTNNNLIINYSRSNRAPNVSELFSDGLHHSSARIETGNLRIQQENSNRFGITWQKNTSIYGITIEGFANYINNFIYIKPVGTEQTIRGAFPVYNYQQTDAFLTGFDASAKVKLNENLGLTSLLSYIYANDVTTNIPLIDIPPFEISNTIGYKNNKFHHLFVNLESVFVAKQNRFPDFNFTAFNSTTNTNVLVDISTPPNAYHLLNLQSGADFNFGKTTASFTLTIQNLTNNTYRNYLNRLRYFADDLGRSITLQITLKY